MTRLRELIEENKLGLGLDLKVRMSIISALYEYNPKHKDYMGDEAFNQAVLETQTLIDSLMTNKDIVIMSENVQDDDESLTEKMNDDGKWHVRGSLVNTCTKVTDQNLNSRSKIVPCSKYKIRTQLKKNELRHLFLDIKLDPNFHKLN